MAKPERHTNEQLIARIQAGEDIADNMFKLWQNNRGIIGKLAGKYSYRAEEEDLKQEGYIALCDAAEHYDISAGVQFISYATYWIKQRMQRYIENCGSTVRIPTHAVESIRKYNKVIREYTVLYGRDPTEKEISALLGVSREKLDQIKKTAQMGQIRSLDEPMQSTDGTTVLSDVISSEEDIEEDVARRMDAAAMSRELWAAVETLPEGQQAVIHARYKDGLTLEETGERVGLTMNQARDWQIKALRTLRKPKNGRKYQPYFEQYISAAPVHHVSAERFKTTWTSEVEREIMRRWECESAENPTKPNMCRQITRKN